MHDPLPGSAACSSSVTFEGGTLVRCTRDEGHGFAHRAILTGRDENGDTVTVEVEW